ncbi:MAG TPA: histidine phosphatase family protein [Gemmatimonadaceae bacterium]|jgi:phosphohistidine phosphatase|nr:histidine phosphatase family protein [Gemmatimonadaceae bacterium]
MHLLIIRHAIAEDRDSFASSGKSDDVRPLTDEGRAKMKLGAEGIRALVPDISLLAASPLTRAQETADIVGKEYGLEIGATTDALRPRAAFPDFVTWLAEQGHQDVVAVVGHEPHLSALATWLICGDKQSRLELKKGGACLIAFAGAPKKGGGTLEWALHPSHLRAIAKQG